ncbi:hypothetical protein PpBr36_01450 [Pyricularia pennisetigena]|uniref:hypothetical protein n=1 Tax=Pyricularia pennisetigena TaxID=1578925 RepID=UPI00114D5FEB|nr:hypothetical protein PpBr36_01450 [Pyricularia pennisetigena]TLS29708.1 hypothetical protein PpBr36_01450 [Pyricularia pennisetigena]
MSGGAPALEYDVYLFSNHSAANVTVFIPPTHNYLDDRKSLTYAVTEAVWGRQGSFTTSRFAVPREGEAVRLNVGAGGLWFFVVIGCLPSFDARTRIRKGFGKELESSIDITVGLVSVGSLSRRNCGGKK